MVVVVVVVVEVVVVDDVVVDVVGGRGRGRWLLDVEGDGRAEAYLRSPQAGDWLVTKSGW